MTLTGEHPIRAERTARGRRDVELGAEWLGVVAWCALVAVATWWGAERVADLNVGLPAAPFNGEWKRRFPEGLAVAAALGLAVAWWGPGLAARLPWRAVPVLTGVVAVAWTVALAASDGWSEVTAPLATRHEYEPFAAGIEDVGAFVDGFAERLVDYPIHVKGHPPGPVLLAWVLDRVGLAGAGWLAVVALAGWGAASAGALVTARIVSGEAVARRAAPALAVLPGAVWAGTSLDGLFAGMVAVGTMLAAVAVAGSSARSSAGSSAAAGSSARSSAHPAVRGVGLAVAAGVVWGAAFLATYGAVPAALVTVAAVVAVGGPRLGTPVTLGLVGLGGLAVLGLAAGAGFWWLDGLDATRAVYWDGLAAERPGTYLTVAGNPAAFAVAVGPAVAAGLASAVVIAARRLRSEGLAAAHRRKAWVLPAAALVAVTAADLSQLSRGEVERIWLPFAPWIALVAPGDKRRWLVAQVAVGVIMQSHLDSPW